MYPYNPTCSYVSASIPVCSYMYICTSQKTLLVSTVPLLARPEDGKDQEREGYDIWAWGLGLRV